MYISRKRCICSGKHRTAFFPFWNLSFQPTIKCALLINIILNRHLLEGSALPSACFAGLLCEEWWKVCPGNGSSPNSLQHFFSIKDQSFSCWSQELIPSLDHRATNWAWRMLVAFLYAWKHTWDVWGVGFLEACFVWLVVFFVCFMYYFVLMFVVFLSMVVCCFVFFWNPCFLPVWRLLKQHKEGTVCCISLKKSSSQGWVGLSWAALNLQSSLQEHESRLDICHGAQVEGKGKAGRVGQVGLRGVNQVAYWRHDMWLIVTQTFFEGVRGSIFW